jgi:hypothetical protein
VSPTRQGGSKITTFSLSANAQASRRVKQDCGSAIPAPRTFQCPKPGNRVNFEVEKGQLDVVLWAEAKDEATKLSNLLDCSVEASKVNCMEAVTGPNAPHDSVNVILYRLFGKAWL